MPKQKSQQGLTVKKENFSEWFSQIIEKAELVDIRNNVKGFIVIRPWGAMIIESIFQVLEKELQIHGHKPTFMPSVIPEENLKKEASHIDKFTPEVFWLEKIKGEKRLALRPTSETVYTPMFKLWIRSHRDLPMKLYQRGSVFRLDTKATRPLIRGREFLWIEAHDAFATKEQAEAQVQEDIQITENFMHKKLGIPFLAMKRPIWDKFGGAEYTVGSDVMMPDGKLIQQPSTHLLGQNFSKVFDAKFKTETGDEDYIWQTAYGPAPSRILVSLISQHSDDKGLILPFNISPVQTILIPIFTKDNKFKILKQVETINSKLKSLEIKSEIDSSEKRPGEKYHEWELKGVPFRLEIGEQELKSKTLTLFNRQTNKKEKIKISDLKNLKNLGKNYDDSLLKKADNSIKGKIIYCSKKSEIKTALKNKKIARIDFCSVNKSGTNCAEMVEKEFGAEIMGIRADKSENPKGNCVVCGNKAKVVVYVGKSY